MIVPIIPGKASEDFTLNSDAKALSLFLIHSFAPFSSLGRGSNASTRTPIAIPIAVSMEAIILPCSLDTVGIFSANEVSLSSTLMIVSLKLVIWLVCL